MIQESLTTESSVSNSPQKDKKIKMNMDKVNKRKASHNLVTRNVSPTKYTVREKQNTSISLSSEESLMSLCESKELEATGTTITSAIGSNEAHHKPSLTFELVSLD